MSDDEKRELDALRRVLAEKSDALVFKRLFGCELERDALRERAVAAEQERDLLQRELAVLRAHVSASWEDECPSEWLLARIDAILRGES